MLTRIYATAWESKDQLKVRGGDGGERWGAWGV